MPSKRGNDQGKGGSVTERGSKKMQPCLSLSTDEGTNTHKETQVHKTSLQTFWPGKVVKLN